MCHGVVGQGTVGAAQHLSQLLIDRHIPRGSATPEP